MKRRLQKSLVVLVLLMFGICSLASNVVEFSPNLLRQVKQTWGGDALDRLMSWRDKELEWSAGKPLAVLGDDELRSYTRFWNKVPYLSDQQHWGMADYWATPIEFLASNGGDCEDYSVAKYFSLKQLGLPPASLRITYVRALRTNQAHMVLAYYPTPDADPYILDNMTNKVLLASERQDLEPVYSFNDDDMWAVGAVNFKGKSSQIRLWSDLLEKMEKERRI
jgi:predicted transglutaminase-like cysteine proteinase